MTALDVRVPQAAGPTSAPTTSQAHWATIEGRERSFDFPAMGGQVRLLVACEPAQAHRADHDLRRVARRIEAWAARITRFSPDSELSALNRCPDVREARVGPTLCAILQRSRAAAERTERTVDVRLLAARLAAEAGGDLPPAPASWSLVPTTRGGLVHRDGPVSFDLDGVGKGWIADRALGLLRAYPAALVDADGDIAVRTATGTAWTLAVAGPGRSDTDIATLDIGVGSPRRLGVATSGTSVHRWRDGRGNRHHLIDPLTGRPAVTDVVQATVIAESALAAECLAKSIVIRGCEEGLDLVERAGAEAALIVLESGEAIASPRSLEWLR